MAEHESIKAYQIEREAGWPPFPCDGYDFARTLERELTAATERAERAEAEAQAAKALAGIRENQCLACGGDGGHLEGCTGTTGLISMIAQRDQWREVAERFRTAVCGQDHCEAISAYDALLAQENGKKPCP